MADKCVFDVVVIGGGHAGIEAAYAAAKMGCQVALVTMDKSKIGAMHCNPSVGGIGKGHLAFEVSALGGMMPKLCSKTYLQAKMLNTRKGPAVQGLRLQIDKIAYQNLASEWMQNIPNLTVIEDEVVELLANYEPTKKITGVVLGKGQTLACRSVVITTGTFLNSAIYVGKERCNPFPSLNPSSNRLTASVEKLIDMKLGRLKTGTPPRVVKSSIDFGQFEYQPSHSLDYLFEFEPVKVEEKAACYVTYTNQATMEIIKENLHKAGYNPALEGMEPRYCPSIETKVKRFPDKFHHHVFVEPESLELDLIYPAGISNSLPADVQEAFIKTIPGFENAVMARPGFMIEYDFLQPINLLHSLEHKQVLGLFFAGQVNGTTGYEEAAAQGIMAGINAALSAQAKPPFILSRQESYIGVMIDDLISLGVDEPYRMFTSRAERRLLLRQDNVFYRLSPYARQLGLIDDALAQEIAAEADLCEQAFALLQGTWGRGDLFAAFHAVEMTPELKEQGQKLLEEAFVQNGLPRPCITPRVMINLHAQVRYHGYLDREVLEAKKAQTYAELEIPDSLDYSAIEGLKKELRQKLAKLRPKNIAQAQLIPGMTPAGIALLIFYTRRKC